MLGFEYLELFKEVLIDLQDFSTKSLEITFYNFIKEKNLLAKDVAKLIRISVTGKTNGISLFDTLEIIGKNGSIKRIENAIKMAKAERGKK